MQNNQIFDRNQLSLSLHNNELSIQLNSADYSDILTFKKSRTGLTVPIIRKNSREYAIHSLFDPEREGRRIADQVAGGGYVVVFGFGACYHIKPLLERDDINGILLIDRDINIIRSILSEIDLSDVLSDSRISILIDKSEEEIRNYLPSNYIPAVTGDFQTLSLRPRVEFEKDYFSGITDSIRNVLDTLSDDYTVQTWFGKRWFTNSISNLAAAEKSTTVIRPQKSIMIAAAGPSLETQLDEICRNRNERFLISTDTALSCLMKNGITPDLVISIDCQQITYHHFMNGYPEGVPLVADLASPPAISRITENTLFFTSGHPFSHYINRNWRKFPFVDTSGGNVTHAALSLADRLGAREIFIYGADYSYPQGKTYARGTYVYPYFHCRADRMQPAENGFYEFLYRNKNIKMTRTGYGYRYITKPMVSYKERLERFANSVSARIIPADGMGERIRIPEQSKSVSSNSSVRLFAAGDFSEDWRSFLSSYRKRLQGLPSPSGSPAVYFSQLDFPEKDVWTTLFPVAAVLRKKYMKRGVSSAVILKEVRSWALDVLSLYLEN